MGRYPIFPLFPFNHSRDTVVAKRTLELKLVLMKNP